MFDSKAQVELFDIMRLLGGKIHRGSIDQLQGEVNEMICLWECHYPASENYFQLHHIMDLVSSIHLDAIYSVLPFSAEMDKISEDMDSSLFLLDTATKAKEDGDKLNWN
jgi:hypothetical protein